MNILSERILRAFWHFVDARYFDNEQGVWAEMYPYGTCTWINSSPFNVLEQQGRRVEIFGGDDIFCARCGLTKDYNLRTGHDWLLVDGRWLIDIWAWVYLSTPLCLYDMEISDHRIVVESLYPGMTRWKRNVCAEQWTEWRALAEQDWKRMLI